MNCVTTLYSLCVRHAFYSLVMGLDFPISMDLTMESGLEAEVEQHGETDEHLHCIIPVNSRSLSRVIIANTLTNRFAFQEHIPS